MSTFHGFLREFGSTFRCDRFTNVNEGEESPLYYLLSHIHSDHLVGLQRKSFTGQIFCSEITRDLLLQLEPATQRIFFNTGFIDKKCRPYYSLGSKKGVKFVVLRVNEPHILRPHDRDIYRVTLLDANHCPGSNMFLVESFDKHDTDLLSVMQAVIYTGDIRADRDWINSLALNPAVRPYLQSRHEAELERGIKLSNIYLDTALALCNVVSLPRRIAIDRTIKLMKRFPRDTKFYINAWTSGYEPFLEAVAETFKTTVHVDRYKWMQFGHIYTADKRDKYFTRDPKKSRFHACEKEWKCDEVWVQGRGCHAFSLEDQAQIRGTRDYPKLKRNVGCGCCVAEGEACKDNNCKRAGDDSALVVYINPAEPISEAKYQAYEAQTLAKLDAAAETSMKSGKKCFESADWPTYLMLPLNRHSTLPELQALVGLFHPETIYPNTIYDQKQFLDYFMLYLSFGNLITSEGRKQIMEDAHKEVNLFKAKNGNKTHMRTSDLHFPDGSVSLPDLDKLHFGVAEPLLLGVQQTPAEASPADGPLAFVDNLSIVLGNQTFAPMLESDVAEAEEEMQATQDYSQGVITDGRPQSTAPSQLNQGSTHPKVNFVHSFALPPPTKRRKVYHELEQPLSQPKASLKVPTRSTPRLALGSPSLPSISASSILQTRAQSSQILPLADAPTPFSSDPICRLPNPSHHSLCRCNRSSWSQRGNRSLSELRQMVRKEKAHRERLLANASSTSTLAALLQEQQQKYLELKQADLERLAVSPALSSFRTQKQSSSPAGYHATVFNQGDRTHTRSTILDTPP